AIIRRELERRPDQLERRRVALAFLVEDLCEDLAQADDPLLVHGAVTQPGTQPLDSLAQQADALVEAIGPAVEPAEPERDLVVVGRVGAELLEGLGRRELIAEALLQRAGFDDEQLDALG